MRYRVKFNKKVRKFIDKHREISSKIYLKADLLAENKIETLDIKKLKGQENCFRLRIGKYRFLYEKRETEIIIFFYDADSRGDIY